MTGKIASETAGQSDKTALFSAVRRAREQCAGVMANPRSEKTQQQYQAAVARLEANSLTPESATNTAAGFYFYRAAWAYVHAKRVADLLTEADRKAKSHDDAGWRECVQAISAASAQLEKYKPDPDLKRRDAGIPGDWAIEVERRVARGETAVKANSKRKALRGLEANWQDQILAVAGHRYKDTVAVLALSGARPSEFESGIRVKKSTSGQVVIEIRGSKTHGGKFGQDLRTLTVDATSSNCGKHLLAQLEASRGELVVTGDAKSISRRVGEYGRAAFPKKRDAVSAYAFRHQVAADLKASGLPDAEISTALGHCSDQTKRFYGAKQSARGGSIVSAIGSREVRQLTRAKILSLENSRENLRERGDGIEYGRSRGQ
ncbi:MAG: hypothetical protein HEQ15_06820 [Betaproteobacteria bacterium]